MINAVAYAVMGLGLLLALWTGVQAGRRRAPTGAQVIAAAVVEAVLIVQSVVAVVRLIGGHPVPETATFIAYLVGVLAPLPLGIYLAWIERTRWGSLSLCFTAVVISVMMLRLMQLWQSGATNV